MKRYLTNQEINTALSLGKEVELFLGRSKEDNEILSWLRLIRRNEMIVVTHTEVFEEGNSGYLDLYSFSYVDPDMAFPEFEFDNLNAAIEFIKLNFGLEDLGFVNQGLIQNEYKELLEKES